MRLLTFIAKESRESYHRIILMATVSGLANGLLLAIVNHAAAKVAKGEDLTQFFLLYMIAFVLFLYGQWFSFAQAVVAIEDAIYNIRIRLTNKIRRVELPFIESIGSHSLYSRLTQNNAIMSQAIPQITSAVQVGILLVFSLLYLGYISPVSFVISILAVTGSIALFLSESRAIKDELQVVASKEAGYFALITHLIEGFKEIRLSQAKNDAILQHITNASQDTKNIRIEVGRQEVKMWGFGRIFIYALMPVLIFIIPSFHYENAADIFKISATLLFMAGPINILVNALPMFNRANIAINDLTFLEEEMDAAIPHEPADTRPVSFNFHKITLEGLCFTYPGKSNEALFSAGPFQETVHEGELLFIIGGNGSGKSTFLKLLTGLYYPTQGTIQVGTDRVDPANYQAYRELFTTVFTDFHLFDKIYGIKNLAKADVDYWLEKMHMQHKVKYQDGGFTSTSLSTGQRKRLALIAAILEEKPILILDEFAADQDPGFRKYFYETLLIELKTMGMTVIAVTHDDHYFHVADRVLKMDEGRMAAYERDDAGLKNKHEGSDNGN
ncbi:Cyclic peptide transporter [Crenothrix polyspora]|uniref:Cyclic peptide transporter n=1 Tax=Crenothrix polyspora TaxID=360316 RepID=A0A1R4H553_9GAMM|nr:cyclic peptide export ABC transporter [Crenothrix polyspora]SJM91307.1 Cyclic peptide transporter [Crenothrix polyspora]